MKILTATAIAASLLLAYPTASDAKYRGGSFRSYSRPSAPAPRPVVKPSPVRPQEQVPPQAPAAAVPTAPSGGSVAPSLLGTAAGVAVGTAIGNAITSDPAAPCYDDNGNARPCSATPAGEQHVR